MSIDPSKVQFSTLDQVDKIAMYSSTTDSSGGGIGIGAQATIAAATAPVFNPTVYMFNIPNPYGKRCLMTLSWSPDGVNYYPQNVPVFYFNATDLSYYWKALGFGGCSDSTIYFGVTTQYTSSQTIYFQFALDSPT